MYTQSRKFILILAVLLYGCEAWSLTLMKERRLRAFENRILRRNLGLRRMKMVSGEGSTMRNFIVCTVHLIQSGCLNLEDSDGQGMWPEWRKVGVLSKC